MGEIDFSVVSGVSGYVPPHNPYEESFSNPISRWNTPRIIQFEPYKKLQYSSDDKKAHIRYEDDEGDHLHYENFMGVVSDSLSTYLGHSHQKNSTESVQG